MTGEFYSRTYSDHPDCSCPHGVPPFTEPKERPAYGTSKWIRS